MFGGYDQWPSGRIAQLVRALPLQGIGRGFESLCAHPLLSISQHCPWSWPGLKEEAKVSPPGPQRFRPVHFRPATRSQHRLLLEPLSVVERGSVRGMEQKVWTAAELEKLSPAERHALFDASVVTDLDQAPEGLLQRVRTRIHQRIAQSEA